MSEKPKRATYDDVRDAPEDRIAELFDGELYLSPRPAIRHARVITVIGGLVRAFESGGVREDRWWILVEPEVHLDCDVFVPDLAGWRTSTLPALPDAPAIDVVPDWVCEVLSPSTADLDRNRKLPLYHHYGVSYVWLVDPKVRTLEALSRGTKDWIRAGFWSGGVAARALPFDGVEIDLSALWL